MSVPVCVNVTKKETEKHVKYLDLEIEVQKCWNLQKVTTIPVVVGALGTVSNNIKENTKLLSSNIQTGTITKNSHIGTAHILRNFLTPLEEKN